MVQRIIRLLNKEFGNTNQAALLLGLFSLFSQILGLFRDRALAHYIGPGQTLDIYYASFRIPDFIFVSIASLFAVTAVLPLLSEKLGHSVDGELNKSSHESRSFFSNTFNFFFLVMLVISIFSYLILPKIAHIIAPGFDSDSILKVVNVSRIMLLSPIFLGLSNLFGSITQLYKKFFLFSLSPIFYNVGIIIGVIFLYPKFGINGLAFGVVLGACLHFLIQLPIAFTHKFLPKISFYFNYVEIKKLLIMSLPRTLGLSMYNITILVLVALASLVASGSISIFNFAFNLQTVPTMIIGLSYAIATFPSLTRLFTLNDIKKFVDQIGSASRQIIFWSLPIVFLFIVLRAQIVRVILGSGNFSWDHTRLVAAMLAVFSFSVLPQSLNTLLVRAFYASGRTWRPLFINLFSTVFTVCFAFLALYLVKIFPQISIFINSSLRIENIIGTNILLLALGYSIGIIINFFLLWYFFQKDFKQHIVKGYISSTFIKSLTASFAIGAVTYFFLGVFDNIFNLDKFFGILFQGLFSGLIGIISGLITLWLLKSEELAQLIDTVKSKFWKAHVVAPSQEEL